MVRYMYSTVCMREGLGRAFDRGVEERERQIEEKST